MPSLFDSLPDASSEEAFTTLLDDPAVRIERIVSHAHASPEGFWYDQPHGVWVLLVRGGATLRLEGPDERIVLKPGDYVWLPPGRRHRVDATDAATMWLAVNVLNVEGRTATSADGLKNAELLDAASEGLYVMPVHHFAATALSAPTRWALLARAHRDIGPG